MALPRELLSYLEKAKGITSNSKEVKEGYIFFAIKGTRFDGHDFVREALSKGATLVVVERHLGLPNILKVENSRKALAESAHIFFGEPSKSLNVVGVTGTNGKTTTTYIIEAILKKAGLKVGLLGTIEYRLGDIVLGGGNTTPDPVLWHRTLKSMLEHGATHVIAEISSHALDQYRIWPSRFQAVIFTNLTQDHLDYHRDMESYFRAKLSLFTDYEYEFALVNADDPYGRRIASLLGDRVLTYGKKGYFRIKSFRTGLSGSYLVMEAGSRTYTFTSSLVGRFQAYNLCAGIAYAVATGIGEEVIRKALKDLHVPGRFEVYTSEKGYRVVVDYAHTPDAVDNVLKTARELAPGRVIAVFGAGGDRDRAKRPLMGQRAERWSDVIILTSDNPRSEDPTGIIEDILKGIRDKNKVLVIPDRKEAIREAMSMARKGDLVAVLGKGHETYQEVKGVKYPFSDREVIKEFL